MDGIKIALGINLTGKMIGMKVRDGGSVNFSKILATCALQRAPLSIPNGQMRAYILNIDSDSLQSSRYLPSFPSHLLSHRKRYKCREGTRPWEDEREDIAERRGGKEEEI